MQLRMEQDGMELGNYDLVLVNTSGGKDSQTMMRHIVELADAQEYPRSRIVAVHADLGRVEWPGVRDLAQVQAEHYGLRFEAIKRPQGDLLTHIEQRGMFPSSTTRYCTSDHKRGQVGKVITMLHQEWGGPFKRRHSNFRVLNCMGFRSQESPARAKKQPLARDKRNSTGGRQVDTWLPILDWTEDQVWASIKESGVPYHPAYDLGMPRLSCVFCIFAPRAALLIAGRAHPTLLDEYCRVEEKIDHRFTVAVSMAEIREAIAQGEEADPVTGAWNM